MSNIKIDSFSSVNSRKDNRVLTSENATYVENCDLSQGYIEPFYKPKLHSEHNFNNIKTIYNYHSNNNDASVSELLMWDEYVNIVESPLVYDNFNRFYYTKPSSQKLTMRSGNDERSVELPSPISVNYSIDAPGIGSSSVLSAKTYLGSLDNEKQFKDLTLKSLTRSGNCYTAKFYFAGASYGAATGFHSNENIPIRVNINDVGLLPFDYSRAGNIENRLNITGYNGEVCGEIYVNEIIYGDENTSWYYNHNNSIVYYPRDLYVIFNIEYFNEDIMESYYCQTFINEFGDESPRSEFSEKISHYEGCRVKISDLEVPSSFANIIKKRRIYRSDSDCNNENMKLIAEINANDNYFLDLNYKVGEKNIITLKDFANPPEGMHGLIAGSQGMLAGFIDNKVYVTNAFQTLTWSEANATSLGSKIISMHSLGNLLIVLTRGTVYSIDHSDFENIVVNDLQCHERCVGTESIALAGDKLFYVARNGLIAVSPSGYENISKNILSRHEWQKLILNNDGLANDVHCYFYDDKLFIARRGADFCKIYDVKNSYFVDYEYGIEAFYYDSFNNELFFATPTKIYIWQDTFIPIKWTYRSKKYHYSEAVNWSWIKLEFGGNSPQSSSAQIKFYVDSVLGVDAEILTFDVMGHRPLRLPCLKEGFEWQFEMVSDDILLNFQLTNSYEELT